MRPNWVNKQAIKAEPQALQQDSQVCIHVFSICQKLEHTKKRNILLLWEISSFTLFICQNEHKYVKYVFKVFNKAVGAYS